MYTGEPVWFRTLLSISVFKLVFICACIQSHSLFMLSVNLSVTLLAFQSHGKMLIQSYADFVQHLVCGSLQCMLFLFSIINTIH